jgi:hypothetical protein
MSVESPRLKVGDARVLVYLFRDESGSNALAYSTDVTGRNIPRPTERTAWTFVTATLHQDIHDDEAIRHISDHNFYIFQNTSRC